jgi:hypothetical protein
VRRCQAALLADPLRIRSGNFGFVLIVEDFGSRSLAAVKPGPCFAYPPYRQFPNSGNNGSTLGSSAFITRSRLKTLNPSSINSHLTGQCFLIFRLFNPIQLRRDGEQAPVETPERALDSCVGKLTAVHLQQVAGSSERLADSGNVGGGGAVGNRGDGQAMCLRRIKPCLVEFTL